MVTKCHFQNIQIKSEFTCYSINYSSIVGFFKNKSQQSDNLTNPDACHVFLSVTSVILLMAVGGHKLWESGFVSSLC